MLFSIAFGVPEKSVFTRLFDLFASSTLANFQDRGLGDATAVMTAPICLCTEVLYHSPSLLSSPQKEKGRDPEEKSAFLDGEGAGYVSGSGRG